MVGLNGLMENWIRSLGEVKPKRDSEATSGQEETPTHTTSKRKSRKEVSHHFVLSMHIRGVHVRTYEICI